MFTADRPRVALRRRTLRRWAPLALIALLAAGCGSAGATASTDAKPGAASTGPANTGAGGGSDMSGMGDMSGMDMGPTPAATGGAAASSEAAAAGDVKPVPTQVLGTAVWQGMK